MFRFLQALGGCAASVASMAMVRDFFPVREGAKVFSLLMLILGVSPLFAPTVGGFVTASLGWQWIFGILALIVSIILVVCWRFLPEGHEPDPSISLRFIPILGGYLEILRQPQFYTYAFAGAFAFAGLFVHVAGSQFIFMQGFGVSPRVYGGLFALLAGGFIGSSQINLLLLRRFNNERIFRAALIGQVAVGFIYLLGTLLGWYGLNLNIALLFVYLACTGMSNPNGAALALAPFSRNAGSASALLGFLQIGMGALASAGVGLLSRGGTLPIVAILSVMPVLGLLILTAGRQRLGDRPELCTSYQA
jgi:DHA1 family bicyclomycin/chloramphenicol resistance-like MFS transporter